MINLPEGWALSTLPESIAIDGLISDGDWIESKDQNPNGSIRLIQLADIGDGDFKNKSKRFMSPDHADALNCTYLESGDVLIARIPDPLGRACLFPDIGQDAVTVVDICLIRTGKKTAIINKLLMYWINSPVIRDLIYANSSGTTRTRITRKKLELFEFPIPPLAEQKVIADKLSTLLAQVETIKARFSRILETLKNLRQSVLNAAVSGKLTEEWRLKNPTEQVRLHVEKHNANKKGLLKIRGKNDWNSVINLFELPTNWDWIENHKLAIDESNAICAGPFGTIFKAKDFRDEGIPIIFLRHVKEAGFNPNKPIFMDRDVWEKWHQDYSVFGGELLVTKLGDPPGECCIFPEGIGVAMVTPDVLKMDVDTEVANKEYLKHFFNSPASKKMVSETAFGATRLRIDMSLFKLFPIPLPPIEEQTEIVRQIEELFVLADYIEQKANAALECVNNLPQSILAKAFCGELTADWRAANPELIRGDNSAKALLERIKVERKTLKKQSKPIPNTVKKKIGSHMSKQIIKVTEALKQAGEPLSGQQLLIAAGYPSDSNTEQLEQFFLDIRNALAIEKSIVKLERDLNSQDWFTLANDSQK
ncbi:restriction endonuclease subunit S [Acinetobacter baumannii]|uniref:restriction endonuclease subunit S n=1 Tax=Acinetobacter baumannii TaxID=470 RepID=UPI00293FF1B9|nr:restriction endonuclease subunit S [Acinetobacter baumannii]MDV4319046.1 restriction endonuclease subunit S [Acinetobacter baumannii]